MKVPLILRNIADRVVAGELTVLEAGVVAHRAHMHLITDGKDVAISPIIPPGWFKVAVKIKSPTTAELEVLACAA